MPLSPAEKQKRYRERQKERLGETEVKRRDADRKKLARKKNRDAAYKHKEYMRKWRAFKKAALSQASPSPELSPYSAPSSLSRAVKRARKALPKSPQKRLKVVASLAATFNVSQESTHETAPPVNKTPEEVKLRVQEFYLSPDITWMAPGRKDVISVVREGKKVHEQRRYLQMTLSEAHALYKEEFPDDRVGLSTFKFLHPDVVLCQSNMPHNVCVCQYHENINLLLKGMVKTINIHNHKDLLQYICCDTGDEECMFGRCDLCKENPSYEKLSTNCTNVQLGVTIKWHQWIRNEEGKSEKVERSGTVNDALQSLSELLPSFKVHCFVKNRQAAYFRSLYTAPTGNHAVLQLDFSENASIIMQDEVQSAHWSHTQVTVFTAVAWSREETNSFCVISDCMSHDKYAAAAFTDSVIDSLQEKLSTHLEKIDIFTDGAAQHFKQKYMFLYATSLLRSKGIRINWHFFTTSHGKGAVDGVGGCVKRGVFSAMKSRCHHVRNAQDYAHCAKTVTHSITILYVDNAAIAGKKMEFDSLWESVVSVPGTHRVHCVRTVEYGIITAATYSEKSGLEYNLVPQSERNDVPTECNDDTTGNAMISIAPGRWYAVYWEPTQYWYIGEVVQRDNDQPDKWQISFLHQTNDGNAFKQANDVQSVSPACLFAEADTPAPSSSTRTRLLKLSEADYKNVLQKFLEM